jgi:hypothetical protein
MSSKASPAGGGFSPSKNDFGPSHHSKDLVRKPTSEQLWLMAPQEQE